jgi:hypothetical protein
MGDSLVTGFGALAESLFGLFLTNQQVSWSIGELLLVTNMCYNYFITVKGQNT